MIGDCEGTRTLTGLDLDLTPTLHSKLKLSSRHRTLSTLPIPSCYTHQQTAPRFKVQDGNIATSLVSHIHSSREIKRQTTGETRDEKRKTPNSSVRYRSLTLSLRPIRTYSSLPSSSNLAPQPTNTTHGPHRIQHTLPHFHSQHQTAYTRGTPDFPPPPGPGRDISGPLYLSAVLYHLDPKRPSIGFGRFVSILDSTRIRLVQPSLHNLLLSLSFVLDCSVLNSSDTRVRVLIYTTRLAS